jgi:hypothetical protein
MDGHCYYVIYRSLRSFVSVVLSARTHADIFGARVIPPSTQQGGEAARHNKIRSLPALGTESEDLVFLLHHGVGVVEALASLDLAAGCAGGEAGCSWFTSASRALRLVAAAGTIVAVAAAGCAVALCLLPLQAPASRGAWHDAGQRSCHACPVREQEAFSAELHYPHVSLQNQIIVQTTDQCIFIVASFILVLPGPPASLCARAAPLQAPPVWGAAHRAPAPHG